MLRQDAVKRFLGLPIVEKPLQTSSTPQVAAPRVPLYMRPADMVVKKLASFMETLRYIRNHFVETQRAAVAKQQRALADLAVKEGRAGQRSGTALMTTEMTTDGMSASQPVGPASRRVAAASPRGLAAASQRKAPPGRPIPTRGERPRKR